MARRVASARYAVNADEPDRRVRAALVFGAGPAGLLFVQYLRRVLGFDGLLLVCEPNAAKRELAERFGAETIDPRAVDVAEAVIEKTGGRRVEYLIEASGAGAVFPVIPGVIRKQATVVIYGHGHSGVELGVLNRVQFREPTIVTPIGASGGFDEDGRPSAYRRALYLIERGEVEVAPFITHRYRSLEDVQGAFADDFRAPEYTKGVVELS
jgi:L-iditol 2-dehydrogenase